MRYLGRARNTEREYHFGTLDIETGIDELFNSPLLGDANYISYCVNGNGFGLPLIDKSFTDFVLETLLQPEYDGYIWYAHNGFGFDMKRFQWLKITEHGFSADILSGSDGSVKSVTVSDGIHTWIFRDSFLLLPRKLDDITKKFGGAYLKKKRRISFDQKPFDPFDPEDEEYAIQDSVALYHSIDNVDSILRCNFNVSIHSAATLPGIAYKAFRTLFTASNKKAGIEGEKYPGINWGLSHAARESYHGGQTIAFKTMPIRDVVSLDANSMYSFVMLNHPLPTGEPKRHVRLPKNADLDKTLCLAVCRIPEGVFPLLKTKGKDGATGNYNGVVSGWFWLFELEEQKKLGADYEVIESYTWDDETKCAARFVELCRKLRMSDYFGALGEIAKLLANSLYGKFAQRIMEYNLMISPDMPDDDSIPVYNPSTKDVIDGLWNVKGKPSYNPDMSHWASFITAKARLLLNSAIQCVGYDKIIYCDTDSIFIERQYLPLTEGIQGNEYGQFKLEKGSRNKGIAFQAIAPKAYLYLDEKNKVSVKNKGIPTRDILKQDGIARIGADNQSVEFISSNNMSQMLKYGKGYGRKAHRVMATENSTTNGYIHNGQWYPRSTELRSVSSIRGDVENNRKTPFYIIKIYDSIISEFNNREGEEIASRG